MYYSYVLALNNDLKHVNWDAHLKFCDSVTAWNKLKTIIFQFCDKHIPKITIKSQCQPPWFDSDIHKLCLKKERLRQKFKLTKKPEHEEKFKIVRTNLKKSWRIR